MTGRRLALVLGLAAVIAVIALALSGALIQQGPVATSSPAVPSPTLVASTGSSPPAPTPSAAAPTRVVRCVPEVGQLPMMLATDPCPDAVLAVELAVAPVRLPIERIAVEPGPFYCTVLWPGVGTPAVCSMFSIRPGQYMHAWVSFRGTDEVAAVMLGLDLPDNLTGPGATRPPWRTTLVTVEVPPAGWVMP